MDTEGKLAKLAMEWLDGKVICPKCGGVGTFSSEGCLAKEANCVKCGFHGKQEGGHDGHTY